MKVNKWLWKLFQTKETGQLNATSASELGPFARKDINETSGKTRMRSKN